MKDRLRIFGTIALFALVFLSIVLLFALMADKGRLYESTGWLVLGVIILAFSVLYLKGGLKDARNGLPFQDERTKKILLHANSTAFKLSIWWLLFLMYIADEIDIIPRHVAAAGIAGMALLFFISWIWYDQRGAPE
jgi:hypothetical protein